jgi:hypothetical protein
MEYKDRYDHLTYDKPTVRRLIKSAVRAAKLAVTMAKDDGYKPLVDIAGSHRQTLKSANAYAPLRPVDKGLVIDRGRNRKRLLYYFPRTETFARGTHFGNQSSFQIVDTPVEMIGIARKLLSDTDFNRVVAGMEMQILPYMEQTYQKAAEKVAARS